MPKAQKKKIFNLRPIFLCFAGGMAGIWFFPDMMYGAVWLKVLLLCGFGALLLLTGFKFKRFTAVLLSVSMVAGFGLMLLNSKYYEAHTINQQTIEVSGHIKTAVENRLVLSRLTNKTSGKSMPGELTLFIKNGKAADLPNVRLGSKVYAQVRIHTTPLFDKKKPDKRKIFSGNLRYTASVQSDTLQITKTKPNIFESIKLKTFKGLYKHLPEDVASLCYAGLFGENSALQTGINEDFQLAGVGHLISVSGLHIALVFAIFNFILKKFKASRSLRLSLISSLLFAYAFLCGFTAAVLRAAIMIIIYMLADLFGKEKDALNVLSIAGIFMLIVSPASLFNVSFQLSFACIFGFICFLQPVSAVLHQKCKFPKALAETAAMSLIAAFITMLLIGVHFGRFNYIAIFANLLLVPAYSVAFILLFGLFLLNLIFPFLSFLFVIPGVLFRVVLLLLRWFAEVNTLPFAAGLWMLPIFFILCFYMSRFCFLKPVPRRLILGSVILLCFLPFVL